MQNNRILAVVVFTLAAALRLATPSEYEFKADEVAMVEIVQRSRDTGTLPWLGMPSSQGFRNPGMSAWPLIGLSHLFGSTGFSLTQAVRILNVLAFLAGIWLALRQRGESRRLWLLGLLLAAVNPIDVVLHRKLWAQSLLPFFSVATFALWLKRPASPSVAFALGLGLAILPQLHLSGLFVSGAIGLGWLWQERRRSSRLGLLAGIAALGWPMVFWFAHLLEVYRSQGSWIGHLLAFRNFHLLFSNLSGVVLSYSLGPHFENFVRAPLIGLAHVGLVILTLSIFVRRKGPFFPENSQRWLSLLGWGVLGTATLMTLAGVYGERHYFLGMWPLPYLGFALLLKRRSEKLIWAVTILQLVVSIGFLLFIHQNGGAPGGDFGALPPQE